MYVGLQSTNKVYRSEYEDEVEAQAVGSFYVVHCKAKEKKEKEKQPAGVSLMIPKEEKE